MYLDELQEFLVNNRKIIHDFDNHQVNLGSLWHYSLESQLMFPKKESIFSKTGTIWSCEYNIFIPQNITQELLSKITKFYLYLFRNLSLFDSSYSGNEFRLERQLQGEFTEFQGSERIYYNQQKIIEINISGGTS